MAKANYDHLIPQLQADFRTGAYSVRKLADKYDVSVGFVAKHTKDVEKDLVEIVNAGVAYKTGLASDNEQNNEHVHKAVSEVVDERTKHLIFFNNSALKNQQLANNRLKEKEHDIELSELEAHSRITARNKETVLGKMPDTAIQINNNLPAIKVEFDD